MDIARSLKPIRRETVLDLFEQGLVPDDADYGDRFFCLHEGNRYGVKALCATALDYQHARFDKQEWQTAASQPFADHLEALGFAVMKESKFIGDTSLTCMLYEVKQSPEVQNNYQRLLSSSTGLFYWNEKKFEKLVVGNSVFVVNSAGREVLFAYVHHKGIPVRYDDERDETSFDHEGQIYSVAGQWEHFVALKIKQTARCSQDWKWKTLGSSENTYLSGEHTNPRADNLQKNMLRVNQLLELFEPNSDAEVQLQTCYAALQHLLASADPVTPAIVEQDRSSTQIASTSWLPAVQAYMAANGFYYSLADVANFYLSLKTKPLVLLAGISGTGKTQLVRQFAKALGYGDPEHCVLIPVRPDWADSSDLIGFENLQGQFVAQPLLKVIERALQNPNEPFFVILDEMNLAKVEHYFAEFLSLIETRQRDEAGLVTTAPWLCCDDVNGGVPLTIPANLLVVGTVNMDETTHPFSRKVLDRANAIEMNEIDLDWVTAMKSSVVSGVEGVFSDALMATRLTALDVLPGERQALAPFMALLQDINRILEPAGLQVGYRVRDEMAFYLAQHHQESLHTLAGFGVDAAMDFQLMQKILPRIQGSSMAVLRVLVQLINRLTGMSFRDDEDFFKVMQADPASKSRYPRSVRKLVFMLQRFHDDGFTSFWL